MNIQTVSQRFRSVRCFVREIFEEMCEQVYAKYTRETRRREESAENSLLAPVAYPPSFARALVFFPFFCLMPRRETTSRSRWSVISFDKG